MEGIFFNNFKTSYIPEILKELYRDRIYASYVEHLTDATILDVGGNIGLATMYFQPFAKRIVTVEPSAEHCDCIRKMAEFNNYNNVEVFQGALSNKDGKTDLFHNDNVTMFSLNNAVYKEGDVKEEVETINMKSLFEKFNIEHVDFMKLDIEGHEFEVIMSKEFEECCKNIDSLVVEYHTWTGRNPSQLVTTLIDYGYDVERLNTEATCFGARRL